MRTEYDNPVFSFLMCTFNDDSLLDKAILSLTSQSFQNWELIVLDNSNTTNIVWETLCQYSQNDNRIRCYRSEENVGWAKGAAICLSKAKGQYMTFLAADDFISENALEKIYNVIIKHNPDIIWVGLEYVNYQDTKMITLGNTIPEYKVYDKENRSEAIIELMRNTYYNSFCHYEKIDFLRKNNIDFYSPYYGDCAGMTKAMSVADTMVCMNDVIYYLSIGTSQTSGYYIWNGYKMFSSQWDSIKMVFHTEGFSQLDKIMYTAMRIAKNQLSVMKSLCDGNLRDDCMNTIYRSISEILIQIKEILEYMPILEIMYYYGRKSYTDEIISLLLQFTNNIGIDEFSKLEQNWLWRLMNVCLEYKDDIFVKVPSINEEDLDYLIDIILDDDNYGAFGMEILMDNCNVYSDETLQAHYEQLQKVIKKYRNFEQKIVSQFNVANIYND